MCYNCGLTPAALIHTFVAQPWDHTDMFDVNSLNEKIYTIRGHSHNARVAGGKARKDSCEGATLRDTDG